MNAVETHFYVFNISKIVLAIWFLLGEVFAGYVIVFGYELLRLIINFNPLDKQNLAQSDDNNDDLNLNKGYNAKDWTSNKN